MAQRDTFVREASKIFQEYAYDLGEDDISSILSNEAYNYWVELSSINSILTERGRQVLSFMQNNVGKFYNMFTAKDIGEGTGLPTRTAAGSTKGLIENGYVTSYSNSPVIYSLTDKGLDSRFE